MRALLWMSALGDPSQDVVLRPVEQGAVLKLKGEAAWALYDGLAAEERCKRRGCKRRGEHVICSTLNLRDPVVCELQLSASFELAGIEGWDLYHSRQDNRHYGAAALDGDAIQLSGDAAGLLGQRTVLVVEDAAAGVLSWDWIEKPAPG